MSVLFRLALAELSSDLKHYEWDCQVDVLGAAGMASIKSKYQISLFRLKYGNDLNCLEEVCEQFKKWTRNELLVRKKRNVDVNALTAKLVVAWVDDVCKGCNGFKFGLIKGTPNLSDIPCETCKGSGKRKANVDVEYDDVANTVIAMANAELDAIRRNIAKKMK